MKVTYTGYTKFVSKKSDPNGRDCLMIGIVYSDPRWVGLRAESKFIPYSFLQDVALWKPNSVIDIQEFNGQVMAIELIK